MNLILIRHGTPERSEGEGATADPPLSDRGHSEAEATAEFLAAEPIDHVVASPLTRAHQTAAPLASRLRLEVETAEGLREIDPFGGAYVPAEEITPDHRVVQDFIDDRFSLFASAGGYERFRDTVVGTLDGIVDANRGRTVAVFCHGTVISTYLAVLLGHDDPFTLLPDYCGLCRVAAGGDGWRTVRSVNETGHVRTAAVRP